MVARSLDTAIEFVRFDNEEEVFVIGGGDLFEQAIDIADRIYLTQVHAEVNGDAFFPALEAGGWQEVAREDFAAIEPNPYDYSFIVLDRCQAEVAHAG